MSDLNTMFNNGMGSYAAYTMGQEQGDEQNKRLMEQRAAELKHQFDTQANPLKLQREQATLDQMAAQLPGIRGQSQSAGVEGEMDIATKSAKMAAKFSELAGTIGAQGMKSLDRDAERARQAVQVMKQYPPHMHKQIYGQLVQQYGGDPNSPMVKGIMTNVPDAEFATTIEAMGNGMATASAKFIQDAAHKKAENESQERVATANNDAKIEAARLAAEARVKAAESRSTLAMSKMNMDQKITYLTGIPAEDRTPTESAQLHSLSSQRLAERTAAANATTPEMLGQSTPQASAQATADRMFPVAPRQAPQAPQAAAPAQDLQAAVKAAGYPYEPNKYNYRINPQTGLAERKSK